MSGNSRNNGKAQAATKDRGQNKRQQAKAAKARADSNNLIGKW